MSVKWPPKDPDEIIDYALDWRPRLVNGDTIQSASWILPDGITVTDPSYDADHHFLWLAGGTLGQTYSFVSRVVTAEGRTMDQTVKITVRTK